MNGEPAMLFVCLGNICRSPLAEAAFRYEAQKRGLAATADSAGTGDWHIGELPDRRARRLAQAKGVPIDHLRARQIVKDDYYRFTHILALDEDNLNTIFARAPSDASARITLLLDWVPGREGQAVADPYFGEEDGFEVTWRDVSLAARSLVARLAQT